MEQKKLYVKPEETVVVMKMQQHLLAGSGETGGGEEGARGFEFTEPED